MIDNPIIERAIAGDSEALEVVLSRVAAVVNRIVRARAPEDMIEDWTQEVLVKILTRISQYRGPKPIEHWASKLAVTTCQDLYRARKRLKRRHPPGIRVDERALEGKSQHDEPENRERVELLLNQLPADDREVLIMLDIEGRPVEEIASLLGRGQSWVKVRAHRAREKLRNWAKKEGWNL